MDLDSVSRPGIDIPSFPSNSDSFQMGSTDAKTIEVDDEEDKENSVPGTTTAPEFERPTEPPDY